MTIHKSYISDRFRACCGAIAKLESIDKDWKNVTCSTCLDVRQNYFKSIENKLMAHRYLYYVLAAPKISDSAYDLMELRAKSFLPPDSPIQKVGSSLAEDYSPEIVNLAMKFLAD